MPWWRWALAGALVGFVHVAAAAPVKHPPRIPSWILIDASSGAVLDEHDADAAHTSGDFNQLMVLLLTLEQAQLNMMPLAAPVTVSAAAAHPAPWATTIPLRADQVYELSDLLKAVALSTADDAAIAVAEAIGGSLDGCVELMNARAQRLGLEATQYAAVGSLLGKRIGPSIEHTSARDLAKLTAALVRHPEMLAWSSLAGVPFAGGVILRNANQLVGGVLGVDGLQVAVSRDANGAINGYDIVATAQRGALRLIAVVLGAADNPGRYAKAAELVEWGFANYDAVEVLTAGDRLAVSVDVPNGAVKQIQPIVGETVAFLRRHNMPVDVTYRLQLPALVAAPLTRHQVLGEVVVERDDRVVSAVPLLSPKDVKATGRFSGF